MKYAKYVISILIVVLVLILGLKILNQRKEALKKGKTAEIIPANVEAVTLKKRFVTLTLPTIGIVKSNINPTVATKITGRIIKLTKNKGDFVKKGELLAVIDNTDIKAKISTTKLEILNVKNSINAAKENVYALDVKLKNLIDTHKRTEKLLKVKGASIEQYEKEETTIAATKAQKKSAENNLKDLRNQIKILNNRLLELKNLLSYSKILSPINGIISEKFVAKGETVFAGKPLFKISSKDNLYIETKIPENIKAKEAIFHGKTYKLKMLNSSESGVSLYKLEGVFNNLVEGEFVNLKLVVYKGENVVLPHNTILSTRDRNYIFLYEEKQPKQIRVKILVSGTEGVITDQDLDGKTAIVAMPDILLRIATGTPINIINRQGY